MSQTFDTYTAVGHQQALTPLPNSECQVAYDSAAKTVTITPVASGFSGSTTFVPSGGIAGITAGTSGGNNTVVVDLTTQTAFGGIAVVATSGTGTTTLSGAIDLSVITAGAANQSITLSTIGGASSTSSLSFSNAIKAKGSGSITLGAGSISGSSTLVASSLSANAATGMTLTESFAMTPAASVSGLYLAHPDAHYFGVAKVERDQVEDYAQRKGMSVAEIERWLSPILNYEPATATAAE
jgi:hypothetical protein